MDRWTLQKITGVLLIVAILAGCTSPSPQGGSKQTALDPDVPVTLKVAYLNEQIFYQSYGNVFNAKYPNVQFEIIPTMEIGHSGDPVQAMLDLMNEHQPDIVVLTTQQYEVLAAEGRLSELDAIIQQTGFDLENMVEGVVELLRDAGGGKLYGLSPTFNTNALYYNKDLFAQYGVPEPTDFMTWEEVLQLAARFPTEGDDDSRIYGFSSSLFVQDAFELIRDIASAKGLQYLNADATELTMNEPEWKEIFREVVEGYRAKTIYKPKLPEQQSGGGFMFSSDSMLFNQGRAAMMVDNSTTMNMMGGGGFSISAVSAGSESSVDSSAESSPPARNEPINWGVVTAPVDAATPDRTSTYTVSQVFAINADSPQSEQAWAFIQYVHSNEAAKIRANTAVDLQARIGYETNASGNNLEPFYKLKPLPMETARWLPKGFPASFQQIANEAINDAIGGSKTIDEAFADLLAKGSDALAEANLSGEKEQGGGMAPMMQGIFIGG